MREAQGTYVPRSDWQKKTLFASTRFYGIIACLAKIRV